MYKLQICWNCLEKLPIRDVITRLIPDQIAVQLPLLPLNLLLLRRRVYDSKRPIERLWQKTISPIKEILSLASS